MRKDITGFGFRTLCHFDCAPLKRPPADYTLLQGQVLYPPPPLNRPFWGLGVYTRGGRIKFLPQGVKMYTPPLPSKLPSGQKSGRGWVYNFSLDFSSYLSCFLSLMVCLMSFLLRFGLSKHASASSGFRFQLGS